MKTVRRSLPVLAVIAALFFAFSDVNGYRRRQRLKLFFIGEEGIIYVGIAPV